MIVYNISTSSKKTDIQTDTIEGLFGWLKHFLEDASLKTIIVISIIDKSKEDFEKQETIGEPYGSD